MPIIETAIPDSPLSQGDVLSGVKLFRTNCADGESIACPDRFCLVLSRPCVAIHKPVVTVAAVEKYSPSIPKDVESFQDMLDFLTDLRDGTDTPDVFYLGSLPDEDGRFCARLDQVHSITLPSSNERQHFLRSHRKATLNGEFRRDLHLRLLRAFASLGFDDYGWFSDHDLSTLLTFADSDLARADAELSQQRIAREKQQIQGHVVAAKPLQSAEDRRSLLAAKFAPYREELSRRGGSSGSSTHDGGS